MKRIYLIDCPGIVPPNNNDTPEDILLRGVVRVEAVENPEQYIAAVLKKTKPQHIERTYDVRGFNTPSEFLELLARKGGRLLKGGEADVDGVAKMVLNDFLRGKVPWYTPPPVSEGLDEKGIEGRKGTLGEMGGRMGIATSSIARRESKDPIDPTHHDQSLRQRDGIDAEDGDDEEDYEGDDDKDGNEVDGDGDHFEGFDEQVDGDVASLRGVFGSITSKDEQSDAGGIGAKVNTT